MLNKDFLKALEQLKSVGEENFIDKLPKPEDLAARVMKGEKIEDVTMEYLIKAGIPEFIAGPLVKQIVDKFNKLAAGQQVEDIFEKQQTKQETTSGLADKLKSMMDSQETAEKAVDEDDIPEFIKNLADKAGVQVVAIHEDDVPDFIKGFAKEQEFKESFTEHPTGKINLKDFMKENPSPDTKKETSFAEMLSQQFQDVEPVDFTHEAVKLTCPVCKEDDLANIHYTYECNDCGTVFELKV